MNQNDPKKHSDTKSEHHDKAASEHGKTQGVTTNPNDVGAGGGSVPVGQHGQDSRTWGTQDNQKNAPHKPDGSSGQNEEKSHGKSGHKENQDPGHKHEAGQGSSHKH